MLVIVAGCGGSAELREESSPPHDETEGGESASLASVWLTGLREGEMLTYTVTLHDETETRVAFRIGQVLRRGDGLAVRLLPVGTPLLDSPVFARWMVADDHALYGLEETASLTQPGFEPLDAGGAIVTEARDAIAWQVERTWAEGSAASRLGAPSSAGSWSIEGHEQTVEGAVRGEQCVRLRQQDGVLVTRMLVCANLGVMELTRTGGDESDEQHWRLVEVGARSEETL